MNRLDILFNQIYVVKGFLAGWTVCPAGKQTGLADSIEVWTRELDRDRFGCLSPQ